MACEYVRDTYGVPADIGVRVVVSGEPGIIVADRGNYIGVNFDRDKPGVIKNAHPTWEVQYGGFGVIRKMTRSQQRYADYMKVSECFDSFLDYLYYRADKGIK